jgi:hypothetical protein
VNSELRIEWPRAEAVQVDVVSVLPLNSKPASRRF